MSGHRPIALDLYAGAGGLSLGLEQSGFDVVGAVEMDPIHALTHRFNFPRTPVLSADLARVSVDELGAVVRAGMASHGIDRCEPVLDAVVGGPPCQGFSVGGVRDEGDERNDQLLRFVDLIVELQPKVFCLENVAGLLEPRFEALRKESIRRLSVDGGYEVTGFEASGERNSLRRASDTTPGPGHGLTSGRSTRARSLGRYQDNGGRGVRRPPERSPLPTPTDDRRS